MQPPWIAFPEIPQGSIGWRMGPGEEYLDQFRAWFSVLPRGEQVQFAERYPEPPAWVGFYEVKTY